MFLSSLMGNNLTKYKGCKSSIVHSHSVPISMENHGGDFSQQGKLFLISGKDLVYLTYRLGCTALLQFNSCDTVKMMLASS